MRGFDFAPYEGADPYIFVRCARDAAAAPFINDLCRRGVRVWFDVCGDMGAAPPDLVADRLRSSAGAVFLLSERACASLDFRNSVNYALSERKRMLTVSLEDFALSQGLEMQLANVPDLKAFALDRDALLGEVLRSAALSQEALGEGQPSPRLTRKRAALLTAVAVCLVAGFLAAAFFVTKGRIAYYNSPAWLLRETNAQSYVDITAFDPDEALAALAGKQVDTLYMADMGLQSLEGVEDVRARVVDVSGNGDVPTLDLLLQCEGLETVRISQDMTVFTRSLLDAGLRVELTK
ncbi:MAG: hypothetical protein VB092_00150 [Oscillospiraceae bacterium]|nr:hypothetical protein [Oscillospiraceae bacterium]